MQVLALFVTLCFGSFSMALNQNPEERIGAYLKSTLNNLSHDEIIKQMELHFLTLNLLVTAQPRKWAHSKFAEHENELIPFDTDKESLQHLIDQIVENALKNPYLHDFLVRFKGPGLDKLFQDIEKDGHWGLNHLLVTEVKCFETQNQNLLLTILHSD